MKNALREYITQLSALLEQEREAGFAHALDLWSNPEKHDAESNYQQIVSEKTAQLSLRVLRLTSILRENEAEQQSLSEMAKEDWQTIVECVKWFEYKRSHADAVCDAAQLLLLLASEERPAVERFVCAQTSLSKEETVSDGVFESAFRMADYYRDHELIYELYTLIENMTALSEKAHAGSQHRELTVEAIGYLSESDPELTCRICERQKHCFEGIEDRLSCEFLELFAKALTTDYTRRVEAYNVTRRCREMYLRVIGEHSWHAARAGVTCATYEAVEGKTEQAEAFFTDFLRKVEDHYYIDADETEEKVCAHVRFVLLNTHLERGSVAELLPELEKYSEYCQKQETVVSPFISIRTAETFRSGYFFEKENFLQAAEHCMCALNAKLPEGMEPFPTDEILLSNLLQIYSRLNDTAQMAQLVNTIEENLVRLQEDDFVYYRLSHILLAAETLLGVPVGEYADEFNEELRQAAEEYCSGAMAEDQSVTVNLAQHAWYFSMISTLLDTFDAGKTELELYRRILQHPLKMPEKYPLSTSQKALLYNTIARCEWQLGLPQVSPSLDRFMALSRQIDKSNGGIIPLMRIAAIIYNSYGKNDLAREAVRDTLERITASCHSAVRFLNDHRLCELLAEHFQSTLLCYTLLRTAENDRVLYQTVLQYKDMVSLVGRERNRILQLAPVDKTLQRRISLLQDAISNEQMNSGLETNERVERMQLELQHLEAEFFSRFPENVLFTQITYEEVCRSLPDRTALIEYFASFGDDLLDGKPTEDLCITLDMFVLIKMDGKVTLRRIANENANAIFEAAEELTELLQQSSAISTVERTKLYTYLYDSLIQPALPLPKEIRRVYIAPDQQLCNIPLEMLRPGVNGESLHDRYEVCRLICGRDILFFDEQAQVAAGAFVMGDADYDLEEAHGASHEPQTRALSAELAERLPFSRIEAMRVSSICQTQAYLGAAASKSALRQALPCGIIHLATHSFFDMQAETDALYSSYLTFSQYNYWLKKDQISKAVITGDEISRMDLHQCGLMVLSSCQSGLENNINGTSQGLLSAVCAAGTHWAVSHLWQVEDLSAPVLMYSFYHALLYDRMSVPQALNKAKTYLREVTVNELRENGWFDPSVLALIPEDARKSIKSLEQMNGRYTPFFDEYYWGGFICHQFV